MGDGVVMWMMGRTLSQEGLTPRQKTWPPPSEDNDGRLWPTADEGSFVVEDAAVDDRRSSLLSSAGGGGGGGGPVAAMVRQPVLGAGGSTSHDDEGRSKVDCIAEEIYASNTNSISETN